MISIDKKNLTKDNSLEEFLDYYLCARIIRVDEYEKNRFKRLI